MDKDLEIQQLKAELDRIKNGIKTCQITMIVDGNDMCDWGWTTIYNCNMRIHKRSK